MKLVKTSGVRIYSRFAANSARIAQIFVSSVLDAGDRSTKITAYHFNAWTSEWRSQVTNINRFIESFVKLDIVLPNVWCALTFRGRELGSVVYLTYLRISSVKRIVSRASENYTQRSPGHLSRHWNRKCRLVYFDFRGIGIRSSHMARSEQGWKC